MIKKLLFLGLLGLLTGCSQNLGDKQTPQSDSILFSEWKTGDYINDFSQLDRSLITWAIDYNECVKRNGTGAIETPQENNPNWHTCKDGEETYYQGSEDNLYRKYGEKIYNTGAANGFITSILDTITLPVSEQNSLIEMFALTGEQIKYRKPQIKLADPELMRTGWFSKPQITVTGDFTKDFEVKWTKNGLHIQKTSKWKDEPTLLMQTRPRNYLNLDTLRHPDTKFPPKEHTYDSEGKRTDTLLPSATETINNYLKTQIGTGKTFTLISQGETEYSQSGEYLGPKTDTYITITFDKIAYQDVGLDPQLCFATFCFNPDKKIQNYKNRYMQTSFEDPQNEEETTIFYNAALKLIIKIENHFMDSHFSWLQQTPNFQIEQVNYSACMTNALKQKVSPQEQALANIPKQLNIFGETFKLQSPNFDEAEDEGKTYLHGSLAKLWPIFENKEDAENRITQYVQNNGVISKSYRLSFAAEPNIKLIYTNEHRKDTPEAVLYSEKAIKTQKDGTLTDLATSKSIYCEMGQRGQFLENTCPNLPNKTKANHDSLWLDEEKTAKADLGPNSSSYSSNDSIIFNQKILPLYKIQPAPISGYYYVYPTSGVNFEYGAGGCKPVIYTYDQLERDNSLTITLPTQSAFTKLIPNFSRGTTWNFSTDKDSQITVNAQTYPYLYYSTWRSNYQTNRYGRTVKAEDIPLFLNDKLDKMNFNQKEKADFLEYWLPEFQPGFVYSMSFKFDEQFAPYAQLSFKHEPEKSFRVFMEAHQLPASTFVSFDPNYPDAGDEKFLRTFERGSSFDMLERGGNLEKIKR